MSARRTWWDEEVGVCMGDEAVEEVEKTETM